MARRKNKALRDLARERTYTALFEGAWPPSFLVYDDEKDVIADWEERQLAVLQATWDEFRDLLGDTPHQQRTGYTTLIALEASLAERLEHTGAQAAQTKGYCAYFERVFRLIYNEGLEHGLETPLGTVFPDSIPIGSEVWDRGWDTQGAGAMREDGTDHKKEISRQGDISFTLRNRSGIESEDPLPPQADFSFSASDSFQKVIETVQQRYRFFEGMYKRWRYTHLLIQFRLSVVRNVRWQFELYGDVEPLTSTQAGQMLQQTPTGRPAAIDYEWLEGILPEFIANPASRYTTGKRQGEINVAAVVRAIEREYDVLNNVSDRLARDAVTRILEKQGLR